MYKLKNKFNDFVVLISEKESFFGDQYFNTTHDPDFMKPKVHHKFIYSFSKYYCLCHLQELQHIFYKIIVLQ